MIPDWLKDLLPVAAGALLGALGWLIKRLTGRVDALEEELSEHEKSLTAHRLHTAENYVTRDHLREEVNRIVSHLLRIEEKIDAR